jgi:hypothetical protein
MGTNLSAAYHTCTSRGGAARDLRDSHRAHLLNYIDFTFRLPTTRARQGVEQHNAISEIHTVLNSINASHLLDAHHHHPDATTTLFAERVHPHQA